MKKITALLISAIIMMIFVPFAASAADTAVCPSFTGELTELAGDINGDGRVTTLDVKKILRHVAGLENIETARIIFADINFDAKITTNDAKTALRITADLIEKVYTAHHVYTVTVTKQANCGDAGTVEYKCSACGDTAALTVPKTGDHRYDDGVVTKKADCNNDGERTYTCRVCGASYKEKIAKTTHELYYDEASDRALCRYCGRDFTDLINTLDALMDYDKYISEQADIFYGEAYSYSDSLEAYNEIFLCFRDMSDMCSAVPELKSVAATYENAYKNMYNAMKSHCDANDMYEPTREMYHDLVDNMDAGILADAKAFDVYSKLVSQVESYIKN